MKILLVAPIEGTGGIKTWANKLVKSFNEKDIEFIRLSCTDRRVKYTNVGTIRALFDGFLDLLHAIFRVYSIIRNQHIDILHETTSGGNGTIRDFFLCLICSKAGIKTILHCHYGAVISTFSKKNLKGFLLRKTLKKYDQIWVLDKMTQNRLDDDPSLNGKVFLTPNFVRVPDTCDLSPKTYRKIGFVGNVQENKGPLLLVEAISRMGNGTELHLVGPIDDSVKNKIIEIGKDSIGSSIFIYGKIPNIIAVELINQFDIISLPTFFPNEAFPVSILEAMSLGKLVVSTNRSAIPDILTALDGSPCGILVREKNVDDIISAILWCQTNCSEADSLCKKAYEKAKTDYQESVVFNLYASLYRRLFYD